MKQELLLQTVENQTNLIMSTAICGILAEIMAKKKKKKGPQEPGMGTWGN